MDNTNQPQPKQITACYGLLCHQHDKCRLYHAVDGLTDGHVIDTCGIGGDKPLFFEVKNA